MKQTLSTLVWEATQIERQIAENGGELSPELETALTEITLDTAEKIDGYHFLTTKLLHSADWYDDQANVYSKLAKTQRTFVKRLKDRVKWAMEKLNVTEIQGKQVRYRLVKRPPKLVIDDVNKIPLTLFKQVNEVVPDKDKILAMLKDGIEVPGASLEEVAALTPYVTGEAKNAKTT